jgi:hypothetical protein
VNLRRSQPAPQVEAVSRHVIAEYKHRAQTVTCECGWHGSTTVHDGRSAWQEHVAANRAGRG